MISEEKEARSLKTFSRYHDFSCETDRTKLKNVSSENRDFCACRSFPISSFFLWNWSNQTQFPASKIGSLFQIAPLICLNAFLRKSVRSAEKIELWLLKKLTRNAFYRKTIAIFIKIATAHVRLFLIFQTVIICL